ncbi:MAG: hypothetical protein M3O46_16595 [Myxococcota bacterium]|nr:hypothetical protein [Myxococcota bacterium]
MPSTGVAFVEMLDDMAATFPAACRTRAVTGPAKRSHPCARPVASARKRRPKAMNARSSAQHPGTAPLDGHVSQGDTRPSMRDSVGGVSNTVVSPKLTVVRPRDSLARATGSRPYPIDSRP